MVKICFGVFLGERGVRKGVNSEKEIFLNITGTWGSSKMLCAQHTKWAWDLLVEGEL